MDEPLIRVLVADDHGIVRQGIRQVLESEPGFVVAAEAASCDDAIAAAAREQPDVVLLDITLPDESGVQGIPRLRAAAPRARIVMLTVHDNREYVLRSVRAGAHGYVRKDTTPAALRAAVRAVHEGGEYFAPEIASHLTAAVRGAGEATLTFDREAARLATLTPREREVLALIVRGHQNKETAGELGISVRTVEAHRDSIMRKLGVRSVAELTRLALTRLSAAEPPEPPEPPT
jgi:two-component system response regulator NreC